MPKLAQTVEAAPLRFGSELWLSSVELVWRVRRGTFLLVRSSVVSSGGNR
jgi:hypothetical protein